MSDRLVWELSKNSREFYRFRLGEYKGHHFVDLRVFLQGESGEPLATKKGLTIPPHLWPQFRQALARVDAALIQAGWLDAEDLVKAEE